MKKFLKVAMLVFVVSFSSCVTNRTYIKDYSEKMRIARTNFPEIYDMYCRGVVSITDVYTYEKDGLPQVGINYRYLK